MTEQLAADFGGLLSGGGGDITITFQDGATASGHSQILSARSPVLKAELSVPMKEAAQKAVTVGCSAHPASRCGSGVTPLSQYSV